MESKTNSQHIVEAVGLTKIFKDFFCLFVSLVVIDAEWLLERTAVSLSAVTPQDGINPNTVNFGT